MKRSALALVPVLFVALPAAVAAAQGVVLEDSLRGSSTGTQSGGSFSPDGWRVTDKNDYILWHIPDDTMTWGAVEFSVRGLRSNDSRPEGADKNEIFHMYDWTYQSADTNYGGYRNNPYKHFIRKTNVLDPARMDSLEIVWAITGSYVEPDTAILTWDPNVTYRFKETWQQDGAGSTVFNTYRDGVLINTSTVSGDYNAGGLAVRIAASNRAPIYPDFGASVDAVYSDVKISSFAGPHLGTRHESKNLAHRCGCSSAAPGPSSLALLLAAALAILSVVVRRPSGKEAS